MISILQKVRSINQAHDSAMRQLREWECAQYDRMYREHSERLDRLLKAQAEAQTQIDDTIRANRERSERDNREVEELLAEAGALIKSVTSKRTRV